MRSYPSCWNKTLTKLGFKRKFKKAKPLPTRRSQYEPLEPRRMLSADALYELQESETVVAAVAYPQVARPMLGAEYVLTVLNSNPEEINREEEHTDEEYSGEYQEPFVVRTEQTLAGPKAVISVNPNFQGQMPSSLWEARLDLQLGGQIIETYDLMIDIADADFREAFLNDRIEEATREVDELPLGQAAAWETRSLDGASPDFIASFVKSQFTEDRSAYSEQTRKRIYDSTLQRSQELDSDRRSAKTVQERDSVDKREASLQQIGLLLTKQLSEDLQSKDAELATAAWSLRDELVATAGTYQTLFAGLQVDHDMFRRYDSKGDETALSFVETGSYAFDDNLEILLGDQQAMIQVTRQSPYRIAASHAVTGSAYVEDGSITQDDQIANGGDDHTLQVVGANGLKQESLLRFKLKDFAGLSDPTPISAAQLQLDELSGTGSVDVYAWKGVVPGGSETVTEGWDESNLTWDHLVGTVGLHSNTQEYTLLDTWNAGTTFDVDATDQVRRALLYGDANGNGVFDAAGAAGDIEAFHLAVVNWNAYVEEFGSKASNEADLLARNDGGLGSGTIDLNDVDDFFRRHGYLRGDYNLDGVIDPNQDYGTDGEDWAVFDRHYGLTNARFTQGDGDFDGTVDQDDFDIWFNQINATAPTATEPEVVFWLRPTDTTSDVSFAATEHPTGTAPTLDISVSPDLVLNRFTLDEGSLSVRYGILGEDFQNTKVRLFKNNGDLITEQTVSGTRGDYELNLAASTLSGITEGDFIYAKLVGTPVSGVQSNFANDQLDFEFTTLSTQIVNSIDDGGMDTLLSSKKSLRELLEVDNALGWYDTISFDDALFTDGAKSLDLSYDSSDSDLNADHLVIEDDVSIVGPGKHLLVVDAREQSRVFRVDSGTSGNVSISGMTITGGTTAWGGGGLYNEGNLTLDSVKIVGNEVTNNSSGGGLYSHSGDVTIVNSVFDDNDTGRLGGGVFYRAYAGEVLDVDNSTFMDNRATDQTGSSNSNGGALVIYAYSTPGSASITNSTFSGNEAEKGGAIFAQGSPTVMILNSTITENEALHNSGGIANPSNAATIELHNNIIVGNISPVLADVDGPVHANSSHNIVGVTTDLTLKDVNQENNNEHGVTDAGLMPLSYYGGLTPTYSLKPDSMAIDMGNSAYQMSDQRGFLEFDDPEKNGLSTLDIGAYEYQGIASASLATIWVTTDEDVGVNGETTLRDAINEAQGYVNAGMDARIEFDSNAFGTNPEVISLEHDEDGNLLPDPLVISSDVTIVGPGKDLLTVDGKDNTQILSVSSGAVVSVSGMSMTRGNTAIGNSGDLTLVDVDLSGNSSSSHGGAIWNSGDLRIERSTIANNLAEGAGGGIRIDAPVYGHINVEIIDTEINNNTGLGGGGLFFATYQGSADILIEGSTFADNLAQSEAGGGGGISLSSSNGTIDLDIKNSSFYRNTADGNSGGTGGAIRITHGIPIQYQLGELAVDIENTTISENTSRSTGGGVSLYFSDATQSDTVNFTNVTIADNSVIDAGSGGGIDVQGDAVISLQNTIVARNTSNAGNDPNDVSGVFAASSSYNLIGVIDGSTNLDGSSSQWGDLATGPLVPGLTALGDYGGPTLTHALLVGSPAVDAGDPLAQAGINGVPELDQRGDGFARVFDSRIDIGAYEASPNSAEVVFVVDESGSMDGEHNWLRETNNNVVTELDYALNQEGIVANRFGLVGFRNFSGEFARTHLMPDGSAFGTSEQFVAAAAGLEATGGGEDGYAAIELALDQSAYGYRAKAPVNIILVTDEDRNLDEFNNPGDQSADFNALKLLLQTYGAQLNVVANATYSWDDNGSLLEALGLTEGDRYFVPLPNGDFEEVLGAVGVSVTHDGVENPPSFTFENTEAEYVDLAIQTSGAAWDLNALRSNDVNLRQSFINAFIDTKVEEILNPFITLLENSALIRSHEYALSDITASSLGAIRVDYTNLSFDTATVDEINDAFELALLDEFNSAVGDTLGEGRDAFFNITELSSSSTETYLAPNVVHESTGPGSGSITLDISDLVQQAASTGTPISGLRLVARLVNNDQDETTSVTLASSITSVNSPTTFDGSASPLLNLSDNRVDEINFSELADVTSSFSVEYTHTNWDEEDGVLRTGFALTHSGGPSTIVRGPLLVQVDNFRWTDPASVGDPNIALLEADGVSSTGTRYYDLTQLPSSALSSIVVDGETIEGGELVFGVASEQRFDYDITILGRLNEAPYFTNTPRYADLSGPFIDLGVGNTFSHTAKALDPEGDSYQFELVDLPGSPAELGWLNPDANDSTRSDDGILTWDSSTTSSAIVGAQFPVRLRVFDGFGASTQQDFTIRITDSNRAPYFIEPGPIVDAFAGSEYSYDANGFDPDFDEVTYRLLSPALPGFNNSSMQIDTNSGKVTWTPRLEDVGSTYTINLEVDDGLAVGNLSYALTVHPGRNNQDPYFSSTPPTEYVIPSYPPASPDQVSPSSIFATLSPDQVLLQDVYTVVPEGSDVVEIVFIIDRSGSMDSEFDWLQDLNIGPGETGFLDAISTQLSEEGLTNVSYGLALFGDGTSDAKKIPVGGGDFGTITQFKDALSNIVASGGNEDGYDAIDEVINDAGDTQFTFTENGGKALILITDDLREANYYNGAPNDFDGIFGEIDGLGASLNVITDTPFDIPFSDPGNTFGLRTFNEVLGSNNWSIQSEQYVVNPTTSLDDLYSESIVPASQVAVFQDFGLFLARTATVQFEIPDLGNSFEQNAYFVFDYKTPTDFKFVGVSIDDQEMQIGHRTSLDWVIDATSPIQGGSLQSGSEYELSFIIDPDTSRATGNLQGQGLFGSVANSYTNDDLYDGSFGLGTRGSGATFDDFVLNLQESGGFIDQDDFFEDFDGTRVLGLTKGSEDISFVASGDGDILVGSGGAFVGYEPVQVGSKQDYVDLAWALDGAAWDLGLLRLSTASNLLSTSFASAYAEFQTSQILDQLSVQISTSDPLDATFIADETYPQFLGYTTHDIGGGLTERRANFSVQIVGDGDWHNYSLLFDQGGTLRGEIPVVLSGAYEYPITVNDPDNDDPLIVTWAPGGQPDGAEIIDDPATPTLGDLVRWNPSSTIDLSSGSVGVDFELIVTDQRGGIGSQGFTVTLDQVTGYGSLPELEDIPLLSTEVGRELSYRAIGSDAEGPVQFFIVEGADEVPDGLKIDRHSGLITWEPSAEFSTSGTLPHQLLVRVIDGTGGRIEKSLQIEVLDPFYGNVDPTFQDVPDLPLLAGSDGIIDFTFTATDDDNDPLSFEVVGPKFLTIETQGNEGLLRWDVNEVPVGRYPALAIVRDGRDGADFHRFLIDVLAPNESPIFVDNVQLPNAVAGAPYEHTLLAYDPFDPQTEGTFLPITNWNEASTDPLILDLPDGLTLTPNADGYSAVLSGTPTTDGLNQSVTITIEDNDPSNDGTTTKTFTLDILPSSPTNLSPSIDTSPRTKIGVLQPFVYRIEASDPENNPLTISVEVTDPNGSILGTGSGIEFDDESRTVRWVPQLSDLVLTNSNPYEFQVTVSDGTNSDIKTFDVYLTGRQQDNFAPQIYDQLYPDAIVDPAAIVGEEYSIQFEAADRDRDAIYWSIVEQSSPRIAFDPRTAELAWTPTVDDLGTQSVTIRAEDALGGVDERTFELLVRTDGQVMGIASSAPNWETPQPSAPMDVEQTQLFEFDLAATDVDGTRLFYYLEPGAPEGMYIRRLGETRAQLVWQTDLSTEVMQYSVAVRVEDAYGEEASELRSIDVNVVANTDLDAPQVTLYVLDPSSVLLADNPVTFQIGVDEHGGLCDVRLTYVRSDDPLQVESVIPVGFGFLGRQAFDTPGIYTVTATVVDENGNSTSTSIDVEVVDPAIVVLPDVEIVSTFSDALTSTTDVSFTVEDNNVAGTSYRLELINPYTGQTIQVLTEQAGETQTGLAPITPQTVPNGIYTLLLSAVNEFGIRVYDDETVEIDSGNVKIGNFSINFVDLEASVIGLPIIIERTYDTLRAEESGDFGFGWTSSLRQIELTTDVRLDEVDQFDSASGFFNGSRISVKLPDGSTAGFTVTAESLPGLGSFLGVAGIVDVTIVPDDPQGPQLRFESYPGPIIFGDGSRLLAGQAGSTTPFHPSLPGSRNNYILEMPNGLTYKIDGATEQQTLVKDRENNTLEFKSSGGVLARNPAGEIISEISVTRDSQNRITEIYDTDGQLIRYDYDPLNGDLASMTNRAGEVTQFQYNQDDTGASIGRPHFLTQILDSRNVTVLETTFDPTSGRLSGLVDGSGSLAAFNYELDAETFTGISALSGHTIERITDANNDPAVNQGQGVPTEVLRNSNGDVVRRLTRLGEDLESADPDDVLWQVVVFDYDTPSSSKDDPNLIGQSKPFIVTEANPGDHNQYVALPPALASASITVITADSEDTANFRAEVWESVQAFDSDGNTTLSMDGLGNTTFYENYDRFGNPGVIIDPLGNRTENRFVDGRLLETTDAEGNITKYGYDANGNLSAVTQFDENGAEVSTSFNYDSAGNLLNSTGPDGITRYFVYDPRGNQTLSYTHWTNPNNTSEQKTLVSRNDYDEEDRVIGTSYYTVDGIEGYADTANLPPTPDWSTSTVYNSAGQVAITTDRFGTSTYTLYDRRGNVVETRTAATDRNGTNVWIVSRTAYDANGSVIANSDPYVVYNSISGPPILSDGAINEEYTPSSDVVQLSDGSAGSVADLFVNQTIYDALGRVVETRRLAGLEITLAVNTSYNENLFESAFDTNYDDSNWAFDHLIARSTTEFDNAGRVDKTIAYDTTDTNDPFDTELTTTYFQYDEAGRQTDVYLIFDVDGDGNSSEFTLVDGFPDPSGDDVIHSQTAYDDAGRQDTTVDAQGTITKFVYDSLGRVVKTIADVGTPGGPAGLHVITETRYDSLGRRFQEIGPYDLVNPPADFAEVTTTYHYGLAGRLERVELPEVTNPLGITGTETGVAQYTYGYDSYGNQTLIRDPMDNDHIGGSLNKETTFEYDEQNRQVKRILPELQVETMEYNPLGQLERTQDFEGRTTDYVYDSFGRLQMKKYFDVGNAPVGDPDVSTGQDRTVSYTYDAYGRPVEIVDSAFAPTATNHVYDNEGRITQIESPQGVINYVYDKLGRQTRTYTSTDNTGVDRITDTEYGYDQLGRLKTVTVRERNDSGDDSLSEETRYKYDRNGNLDQTMLPNDVISDYVYDNLNRLDELVHFKDDLTVNGQYDIGETLLGRYDYTVRADGKRTSVQETDAQDQATAIDWAYDELGRLVEERYNAPGTNDDFIARYGYDLASNRQWKGTDENPDLTNPSYTPTFDTTVDYAYDNNDRLLTEDSIGNTDTTTTYEYGGLGNPDTQQTKKTVTGDVNSTTTYHYNEQGRLERVEIDEGSNGVEEIIRYEYNDSGVRVLAESIDPVNGNTVQERTIYHIDPQNHTGYAQILEEGSEPGTGDGKLQSVELDRSYTLGHDVISQAESNATIYHLMYDGHGSTRALLQGAIAAIASDQQFAYDAFGNRLDAVTALTRLLYSGEQTDSTGLQYLRARYYDSASGRFNRLDPFAGNINDPQSLHKYLYVHADPANGLDPLGLFTLTGVSAASGIGATLNALTAESGSSLTQTLGAGDLTLEGQAFDAILSYTPQWIKDAAGAFGSFIVQNAESLGFASTLTVIGAAFLSGNGSLSSRLRGYNNRIADLLGGVPSSKHVHDSFLRRVRPGARERKFSLGGLTSSTGLGSRKFDDFDDVAGIGFEANTTPWSQLTQQQLQRKLNQAAADFILLNENPLVKRVVWFGTEPLPSTGLGGQLQRALRDSGIDYWVVVP